MVPDDLKEVVSIVLPGASIINYSYGNGTIEYNDSKIFVFNEYKKAEKFRDSTLKKFFNDHKNMLLKMFSDYSKRENVFEMVDQEKMFKFFEDNYDKIIGNSFSHSNKVLVLSEIRKNPLDFVLSLGNDDEEISEFLFPFVNLNEVVDEIAEGMEFRVYEHGNYFFVPEVKLS